MSHTSLTEVNVNVIGKSDNMIKIKYKMECFKPIRSTCVLACHICCESKNFWKQELNNLAHDFAGICRMILNVIVNSKFKQIQASGKSAFSCSKSTIETSEQSVKSVRS